MLYRTALKFLTSYKATSYASLKLDIIKIIYFNKSDFLNKQSKYDVNYIGSISEFRLRSFKNSFMV